MSEEPTNTEDRKPFYQQVEEIAPDIAELRRRAKAAREEPGPPTAGKPAD